MRFPSFLKKRQFHFVLAGCALPLVCNGIGASQETNTPVADVHQSVGTASISELAHRVMIAGLKANALAGNDLQPWHMRMDFQVIPPGGKKPVNGTMEEWYFSPGKWARTFKSTEQRFSGSEWSVSETQQFESKPSKVGFDERLLVLWVARPVVDPLYQTANVQPDYEMDVKRANAAGGVLNCISVIDPQRYADRANPDWLIPTMCFDREYHLRLTTTTDTTTHFDDLQPFEGRTVARDVKVLSNGALIAEMKVTLLESLKEASPDLTKPTKDAVPLPYTIEPGHPKPVSIYEVGASVPIQPNGFPFRGSFPIPVVIHKDGTVKARNDDTSFWTQGLKDALVVAINKWKYKPYLVDGQPVEVAWTVDYIIDGKPFVPSYERTEPQVVPAQQDSPGTSSPSVARRRYGH